MSKLIRYIGRKAAFLSGKAKIAVANQRGTARSAAFLGSSNG